VWATLGASRLKSVWLPTICRSVVIFADNGESGLRLAHEAATRFRRQGLSAFVQAPPRNFGDYNDELRARATA
jgi:hypothetical protein